MDSENISNASGNLWWAFDVWSHTHPLAHSCSYPHTVTSVPLWKICPPSVSLWISEPSDNFCCWRWILILTLTFPPNRPINQKKPRGEIKTQPFPQTDFDLWVLIRAAFNKLSAGNSHSLQVKMKLADVRRRNVRSCKTTLKLLQRLRFKF